MKHLLLTILLITITTACKKKSMVIIQAQSLNNAADGSAYAGQEYVVVESWTPVYEVKTKRIASGVLDQNGYAAFEIKMKNNKKYNLSIGQPDNICYGGVGLMNQSLASLDHQKNNTINFGYAPCGYVNICFNNINCEGTTDKMQYKYYYTDNPDIYVYRGFGTLDTWNNLIFVEGCIDTCGSYFSIPAGNYTFEWIVERPSGPTTGVDYFIVTENDTTTYLLDY